MSLVCSNTHLYNYNKAAAAKSTSSSSDIEKQALHNHYCKCLLCTDCALPNEIPQSQTILVRAFFQCGQSQHEPVKVSGNRLAIVGEPLHATRPVWMDLKDRVLHVMTTYVDGCVVPLFLNIRRYVEVRGYRQCQDAGLVVDGIKTCGPGLQCTEYHCRL